MRRLMLRLAGPFLAVLAVAPSVHGQSGYGASVTVGDGEVLVGESTSDLFPGSVHVYSNDGSEWTGIQRLQASDATDGDHFGRALATDGNTLIVGATVHANTLGAAYVFERSGGEWTENLPIACGVFCGEGRRRPTAS